MRFAFLSIRVDVISTADISCIIELGSRFDLILGGYFLNMLRTCACI